MSEVREFHAVYERDPGGAWVVELEEEPRVHSFGRTLAKAREQIEDAAALWYEIDPDRIGVVDDVRLPRPAKTALAKAVEARMRAGDAQELAADLTRNAAKQLQRHVDLSGRDIGYLLGISHQRVHQLTHDDVVTVVK